MKSFRLALLTAFALACGDSGGGTTGAAVDVSSVFSPGTVLRDHYGQRSVTVNGDGEVELTPDPAGILLLERENATPTPFNWANVTMYQVLVDRFANGDAANDNSYGRQKDGRDEIGTWHGGDWKGLEGQLDYIAGLGVDGIWISPIVENVRGWVSSGTFKHYGYHGYWTLDFTRLDKNFGSESDLQALVDAAHARGIRVIVDVVVNHAGYATGADLLVDLPEVFKDGTGAAFMDFDESATTGLNMWNDLVDYQSTEWQKWWSPKWIRATFPGFPGPGTGDQTMQVSGLPDFLTESTQPADVPVLFTRKEDTGFVEQPGFTVRQYVVKWHADWVRRFGFDGFRVDTAKHVELATHSALKAAAAEALAEWKAENPSKKIDDAPFWMTAEVFPHGVMKDAYYTSGGFDSVINFDFAAAVAILRSELSLLDVADDLELTYASMASKIFGDASFGILSYISSHDTRLNFDFVTRDPEKQRQAGTALLLAPGGVNIFYGDESGRPGGPAGGSNDQPTRSDMNFATSDATILSHWQKLGTFRARHAAVGAGAHQRLASPAGTYAFSRKLGDDAVVVILGATP